MAIILNKLATEIDRDFLEGLDNQPKESFVFDDFSFPVSNLKVNPATSKPDFNQNEIEYLFDGATTETVTGAAITSHGFKKGVEGLEWYPHIHWMQERAGTVVWELTYKIHCIGGEEPIWSTPITTTTVSETYTSGTIHQISIFDPIDVSEIDTTACIVKVKVSRLGADVNDTYAGDVRFNAFDFHVPIDQLGSRQEYIK